MLRNGLLALSAVVLTLGGVSFAALAAPSFSCDGRLNQTETVICSVEDLSDLDVKLRDALSCALGFSQ